MNFTKMHGTGNVFVVLDGREMTQDWAALSIAMCDRHFGIGSDGILVVANSRIADVKMRMFNPDGSESEMCGNGIRCFTKFLIDEGLTEGREQLKIETLSGVHLATAKRDKSGAIASVRVGMGRPTTRPESIPVATYGAGPIKDYPLVIEGITIPVTCVSMGNPHAVAFLDESVKNWPLERLGPIVEHHEFFPRRVNFEIVNVKDRGHIDARVWERGAGITLACGSGACAIAVASWLQDKTGESVEITLPGGTLRVDWNGIDEVWLEGPAETVYKGEWLKS